MSTNPGAYPVWITFSYLNDKSEVVNDEQVITLLVYSLPNVDVSFYRPPDPFFAGQPGMLPIQVVNVSKRLSVLGNMKIESEDGIIENGTSLVGSLDAGGYFTLDAMLTPNEPGTVTLDVGLSLIRAVTLVLVLYWAYELIGRKSSARAARLRRRGFF